jgi:cyclic pyranopterin monophosphate synthase
MSDGFTHFDDAGAARMVDVGGKPETERTATASALVRMDPATRAKIQAGTASKKGDVLAVARIAGIMAAKKTGDLIPLCHPLALTSVSVDFSWPDDPELLAVEATARIFGRTGVEMEALSAVTVAALTIYDMCKAVDRGMTIERVRLEAKSGGRSGDFRRGAEQR